MIKFFRKLRQRMLIESKFSKYLLYAIGEIVLVVIGILIALQLNNYNDTLAQSKLEHKAIKNLTLDFDYNRSGLENAIKKSEGLKENCLFILGQTGSKYQAPFDLDSLIQSATSISRYYAQNGFLMDLINSGKLGLVKNDLLRNKLSSWLPALETLKDREASSINFGDDVVRYVIKNGSWLNSDEKTANELVAGIPFPKSGFEIDNNDMLLQVEFENLVENQIVYQSFLLQRQKECLELNMEIIELLESELEK